MDFPKPPAILNQRDLLASDFSQNSVSTLLQVYAWMHLARTGDNRILDLFRQGLIKGTVTGGQGNESLIVPLALLVEKLYQPPHWLGFSIWIPLTLIMSLALLQPIKGAVVGWQWAQRMHGFDPSHVDEIEAMKDAR